MEAEKAVHPLDILTRDGWIHTLSLLDTPRDRWNTSNSHPLFRSIFKSELKEEWLSAQSFATLPYLLNYLSFPNVLNLRLVDKDIKSTVDHCLKQGHVHALANFRNLLNLNPFHLIPNENEEGYTIQTRPITNWMNLDLRCHGIQDRFMDFLPFFRQHGSQVYKFYASCFVGQGQSAFPLKAVKYLKNVLPHIPNVKVLNLWVDCDYAEQGVPHCWWADQVATFLQENPLSPLPLLENMDFVFPEAQHILSGFPSYASVILQAFLQTYGPQLRELALLRNASVLPKPMPHLRTIWFKLENAEQFASVQTSGAPLEYMNVRIERNSSLVPRQFFLALEPFQSTLVELNVRTDNWEFGLIEPLPINWPHLEYLEIIGDFNGCSGNSLPFLDNFPGLNCVVIVILQRTGSSYAQLMEDEPFYKSSIWARLHSLECVRVSLGNNSRLFRRSIYQEQYAHHNQF